MGLLCADELHKLYLDKLYEDTIRELVAGIEPVIKRMQIHAAFNNASTIYVHSTFHIRI